MFLIMMDKKINFEQSYFFPLMVLGHVLYGTNIFVDWIFVALFSLLLLILRRVPITPTDVTDTLLKEKSGWDNVHGLWAFSPLFDTKTDSLTFS
jgi:hypothetical protein